MFHVLDFIDDPIYLYSSAFDKLESFEFWENLMTLVSLLSGSKQVLKTIYNIFIRMFIFARMKLSITCKVLQQKTGRNDGKWLIRLSWI